VPAAAVIPAPIAYVNVVAVKKLVVGSRRPSAGGLFGPTGTIRGVNVLPEGFRVLLTECSESPAGLL
jgi:hypothetical protein